MANLLYYWWDVKGMVINPGYTSFAAINNRLDQIMTIYYDGYRNVNIGRTIEKFCADHTVDTSVSYNYDWNPLFDMVKQSIDGGKPCLVGFKAGSDENLTYSETAGHMTCCVGYVQSGTTNYIQLADGHESYVVTKQWSSYNDFVFTCTITLDDLHQADNVDDETSVQ